MSLSDLKTVRGYHGSVEEQYSRACGGRVEDREQPDSEFLLVPGVQVFPA